MQTQKYYVPALERATGKSAQRIIPTKGWLGTIEAEESHVRQVNEVTAEFLRKFKVGDLVDVREVRKKHGVWTGPHKILAYKIDPPAKDAKPAAYMEIGLGEGKKLERWLIAGEHQVIRKHIPEEQKQRI